MDRDHFRLPTLGLSRRAGIPLALALFVAAAIPIAAQAGGMTCRKVVSKDVSGEGRNALKASRVRCDNDEFLTGGTCYPEVRPEPDGTCQTSAMGIIQTLAEFPESTQGAFFTCLQTGGSECPVEERTRAMAICCKSVEAATSSPAADAPNAQTAPAPAPDKAKKAN
jgi:hypothetical protein